MKLCAKFDAAEICTETLFTHFYKKVLEGGRIPPEICGKELFFKKSSFPNNINSESEIAAVGGFDILDILRGDISYLFAGDIVKLT